MVPSSTSGVETRFRRGAEVDEAAAKATEKNVDKCMIPKFTCEYGSSCPKGRETERQEQDESVKEVERLDSGEGKRKKGT